VGGVIPDTHHDVGVLVTFRQQPAGNAVRNLQKVINLLDQPKIVLAALICEVEYLRRNVGEVFTA
jgi:hypothetical protein